MSDSVLVLHTGDTIGMVHTPDGHPPVVGALGPYLDWIVESSSGSQIPTTTRMMRRDIAGGLARHD